jgi:hypothetical protein
MLLLVQPFLCPEAAERGGKVRPLKALPGAVLTLTLDLARASGDVLDRPADSSFGYNLFALQSALPSLFGESERHFTDRQLHTQKLLRTVPKGNSDG